MTEEINIAKENKKLIFLNMISFLLIFLIFILFIFSLNAKLILAEEISQSQLKVMLIENPKETMNNYFSRSWVLIESQPSILENENILKEVVERDYIKFLGIVEKNSGLLKKEVIKKQVFQLIEKEMSVLKEQCTLCYSFNNEFKKIKKSWLESYGIIEKDSWIFDLNKTQDKIFTNFAINDHSQELSFDLKKFANSEISQEGLKWNKYSNVIFFYYGAFDMIGDGIKVDGKQKTYFFSMIMSNAKISLNENLDYKIKFSVKNEYPSIILMGNKRIELSCKSGEKEEFCDFYFSKVGDEITIDGQKTTINFLIKETRVITNTDEDTYALNKKIIALGKFSLSSDKIILEKNSEITTYSQNNKNLLFSSTINKDFRVSTEEQTIIYLFNDQCEKRLSKINCVEIDSGEKQIYVLIKKGNVKIETFFNSDYSLLIVDKNVGGNLIFVDRGNLKLIFDTEPIKIEGYLNDSSLNLIRRYNYNREEHELRIIDKNLEICSACEKIGEIGKIDFSKLKTTQIKLLDTLYQWSMNAQDNEEYTAMGGCKGEMVYPDKYESMKISSSTSIEEYKEMLISESQSNIQEYYLKIEEMEQRKKDIQNKKIYSRDPQAEIKELDEEISGAREIISKEEERINQFSKIKYAYDCVGFVQGGLIESEKEISSSVSSWYKETDGFLVAEKLTKKYGFNSVLVIYGERINKTYYLHGNLKEPRPIPRDVLNAGMKIMFFSSKDERNEFIRTLPAGTPFLNYNSHGDPSHSGIKGISETSIEALITIKEIKLKSIEEYNDPLLFSYPNKVIISFEDLFNLS